MTTASTDQQILYLSKVIGATIAYLRMDHSKKKIHPMSTDKFLQSHGGVVAMRHLAADLEANDQFPLNAEVNDVVGLLQKQMNCTLFSGPPLTDLFLNLQEKHKDHSLPDGEEVLSSLKDYINQSIKEGREHQARIVHDLMHMVYLVQNYNKPDNIKHVINLALLVEPKLESFYSIHDDHTQDSLDNMDHKLFISHCIEQLVQHPFFSKSFAESLMNNEYEHALSHDFIKSMEIVIPSHSSDSNLISKIVGLFKSAS